MKTVTVLVMTLISSIAIANDNHRQSVPGGFKADHGFYKQWESMVRGQRFPQLPIASKLKTPSTDKVSATAAQRYIFQLDTGSVDFKNEVFEDGYFYFVYKNKAQGNYLLAVHPKYRDCFDDLKKKFDFMQWVVFPYGKLMGLPILTLEKPRQCLGSLKTTGSKLSTAAGELK